MIPGPGAQEGVDPRGTTSSQVAGWLSQIRVCYPWLAMKSEMEDELGDQIQRGTEWYQLNEFSRFSNFSG